MQNIHVKIGQNGRVVIPAEFRRSLGISEGDEMVLILEADGIRLMTLRAAIAHAQRVFAPLKARAGKSAVDELIADRRAEAKREERRR